MKSWYPPCFFFVLCVCAWFLIDISNALHKPSEKLIKADTVTTIVKDNQTSCEYLVTAGGGIVPRFHANGTIVCQEITP